MSELTIIRMFAMYLTTVFLPTLITLFLNRLQRPATSVVFDFDTPLLFVLVTFVLQRRCLRIYEERGRSPGRNADTNNILTRKAMPIIHLRLLDTIYQLLNTQCDI